MIVATPIESLLPDGAIADRRQIILPQLLSAASREVLGNPRPLIPGGPWTPLKSTLRGLHSSTREGRTSILLTSFKGEPIFQFQVEGEFGATQIALTSNASFVLMASEDREAMPIRPKRIICIAADGTSLLNDRERLFMFGLKSAQQISIGRPADDFLTATFVD